MHIYNTGPKYMKTITRQNARRGIIILSIPA